MGLLNLGDSHFVFLYGRLISKRLVSVGTIDIKILDYDIDGCGMNDFLFKFFNLNKLYDGW